MTDSARITENFEYGGIGIFLMRGGGDLGRVVKGRSYSTSKTATYVPGTEQNAAPDPDFGPFVMLTDSEARAVLQALTRYYDGAEDTRSLRRDYDAERARFDKLLDRVFGT